MYDFPQTLLQETLNTMRTTQKEDMNLWAGGLDEKRAFSGKEGMREEIGCKQLKYSI